MFENTSISIPSTSRHVQWNPFIDFFYSVYEIEFNLTGCTDQVQFQNISETVHRVCSDILPSSTLHLEPTDPAEFGRIRLYQRQIDVFRVSIISAIAGVIVTTPFLALIITALFNLIRFLVSDLRSLPEDMSWSYLLYLKRPWEWDRQGSDRAWFHFREFKSGNNHPSLPLSCPSFPLVAL